MLPARPTPLLKTPDRAELLRYFHETWRLNAWLFSAVDDDAFGEKPDPLRNPLIFYLGHTAAFYINKLAVAGLRDGGLDPDLDELLARGVDPDTSRELASFPQIALSDVRRYRAEAFSAVSDFIASMSVDGPITAEDPRWALLMGLEHGRIHFETSSVLIRQLSLDRLTRPEGWLDAPAGGEPAPPRWLDVPGQTVALGRPGGLPTFGWDNEFGRQVVDVAPFAATADLVTNRAFLAFVQAGGYRDASLWSEAGWAWRAAHGVTRPRFWVGSDETPRYRAMFDERPMPWAWPVEVCCHEAEAFCRWAGGRLPTEAEHTALAAGAPEDERGDTPGTSAYNLSLRYGSPCPVGSMGRTPAGFSDVYGNVWQWLSDDFHPLPGFAPHPYYADFSEPYFDDQHAAMIGGAWASTGACASRFYRLWFRRHFYQHAGFRMVRTRS